MVKEIEVVIDENGKVTIEGFGLSPNERIEDIAKFITNDLASAIEAGHKHTHVVAETTKQRQKN